MQHLNEKLGSGFTAMTYNTNKRDSGFNDINPDMNEMKKLLKQVLVKNKNSSPYKMDSSKDQGTTTVVPANKNAPPLKDVHYTKMVACELSNMILSHQSSMKYPLRQNSKATLLSTSITYKTASRCV